MSEVYCQLVHYYLILCQKQDCLLVWSQVNSGTAHLSEHDKIRLLTYLNVA